MAVVDKTSVVRRRRYPKHPDDRKCYKCPDDNCNMTFDYYNRLMRHVESVHHHIRHQCPVAGCKSHFGRRDTLSKHIRDRHDLDPKIFS